MSDVKMRVDPSFKKRVEKLQEILSGKGLDVSEREVTEILGHMPQPKFVIKIPRRRRRSCGLIELIDD